MLSLRGCEPMANEAGRPTVITPEVVSLLIASFHSGLTVREACWQSGISHEAYYSRLRSDEQFADTMARAQSDITITAKKLVTKDIRNGSVSAAKWWLERNRTATESNPNEIPNLPDTEEDLASLDRLIELRKLMDEDRKRGYVVDESN